MNQSLEFSVSIERPTLSPMAPQNVSIQSFFQPEVPSVRNPQKPAIHQQLPDTGDGFTPSEIEAATHPNLHRWQPRTAYQETNIGDLLAGPGCVVLMGRVVNFFDQATPSKMPQAAKGCLKVVVKDDTGAIDVSSVWLCCLPPSLKMLVHPFAQVKLWYSKVDYHLRLGLLVSIWTPHVSSAESSSLTLQVSSLVTSIFPERDNSCYFMVQEQSDEGVLCKTPFGYRDGKDLDGLVTLRSFIDGGHEVAGVKILVCVKSIGMRKKCECLTVLLSLICIW